MSKSVTQNTKKRNWCAVAYPESAPDDWLDILRATGLPIAISPLHDKDVEGDGITPKKPHWHIIMSWPGPTTFAVAKKLTDSIKATIPQALESIRGNYRYFTHKDDPDKAQYNDCDIQLVNGFNVQDFVEMTKSEVLQISKQLLRTIQDQGFVEHSHFMDWLMENGTPEEFDVARSSTYFFATYLTSRRNVMRSALSTLPRPTATAK